jgi:hypothetical protein
LEQLRFFNLNSTYVKADASDAYVIAATAYARSGPKPFFMIESDYETVGGSDNLRKAFCQSITSGACGWLRGECRDGRSAPLVRVVAASPMSSRTT